MPVLVLTVYLALIVWGVLLLKGLRSHSYRPFLFFGIGLMLFLNIGYFVNGVPASIASFIGIYDVLINVGLPEETDAAAIAKCRDNACTVWGERFVNHPAWGTAFYDRFANGPAVRSTLLYGHIGFNSIAFVLMHFQLFRPGYGENRALHRLVRSHDFCFTHPKRNLCNLACLAARICRRIRRPARTVRLLLHGSLRLRVRDFGHSQSALWRRGSTPDLDVPLHRFNVGFVLAISGHAVCH